MLEVLKKLGRSSALGYVAAVTAPLLATLLFTWLPLPAFLFEHVAILLVVAFSIAWGLGAAATTAVMTVLADSLLLLEPIGEPATTGLREAVDLSLFVGVALIFSGLVSKARNERARAEEAAERERRVREDRDRLIATVSHDLATPLAVLGGTLQFVRRSGISTEGELPRLVSRLETATARATSLVKTLAEAHALDTEQLALKVAPVDLRDLIAPVVEMFDRWSDRHPVVLAVPDRPVIVEGDADRLTRVVENLVSNAIKYSPNGGAVEVSLDLESEHARIGVRDYGMGISDDALPHIYERAYRAPEASATAPGLGLGLTIATQIISRHGGRMDVRRADGAGTIVSLRLPLSRAGWARVPVSASLESSRV